MRNGQKSIKISEFGNKSVEIISSFGNKDQIIGFQNYFQIWKYFCLKKFPKCFVKKGYSQEQ